ncbi:MAG: YifB family Mg chelatase-like AAA ATPase [Anaerovoracaceae bacterium]|nr:YifB family Mg chelatase-like AAA ATPase [Anaerovoracaceae bacterium]
MLAVTRTAALSGIEGISVKVEVDSGPGLPSFNVIGLGDTAVKEAADRVRSAIVNSGFEYPRGRVTVNLSPAWIHKKGSHYDLSMAVGVLAAQGRIGIKDTEGKAFVGELALGGQVRGVKGILPMISGLMGQINEIYLPEENCREAVLAAAGLGIRIAGVRNLAETVDMLTGKSPVRYRTERDVQLYGNEVQDLTGKKSDDSHIDFADVKGHWAAKEAIVTAVAGGHSLLMIGPPGTGKTMLARRIPTILPEMTPEEQLETSMIYSLIGRLSSQRPIIKERPFRQVSRRTSPAALLGGGYEPLPGEISLACNGILFMDEFLEADRAQIELLRKPMEEKKITIIRRSKPYTFPAKFTLAAAANPCRCGYLGDPDHQCTCSQTEIDRYRSKLSGPICERIDMCIEISRVNYKALTEAESADSAEMRKRVTAARDIQRERFKSLTFDTNAMMDEKHIEEFCSLGPKERKFMKKAYEKYSLSPRRYHKILKLARTAADLQECRDIEICHLATALNYTRFFGGEQT